MQVASCGSNSHGQLGIDDLEDRHVFTLSPFQFSSRVVFMDGGANHSAFLLENGDLYTCGLNDERQLGREGDGMGKIMLKKCLTVSCGWSQTAVIHDDGKSFTQFGMYSTSFSDDVFRQVSVGLRHSVLIGDKVWLWGDNRHGQLGLDETKKVPTSLPLDSLYPPLHSDEKIVSASCGQWHTLLLTSQGRVYSSGNNKFGQLGYSECYRSFRLVSLPYAAKSIQSGWSHNLVQLENGQVYGWGRCDHGQLPGIVGNSQRIPFINQPTLIPLLENVDYISLGSEHGMALKNNQVVSFGWNEHGNCGVGNVQDVLQPTCLLLPLQPTLIACGYGHSLIA